VKVSVFRSRTCAVKLKEEHQEGSRYLARRPAPIMSKTASMAAAVAAVSRGRGRANAEPMTEASESFRSYLPGGWLAAEGKQIRAFLCLWMPPFSCLNECLVE
jgi:hypothetical protein